MCVPPPPHPHLHRYQVEDRGEPKALFPEELAALVLRKLRMNAEALAGATVQFCVIALPPEFTSAQAGAFKIAAKLAGFCVLRVVTDLDCINITRAIELGDMDGDADDEDVVLVDLGADGLGLSYGTIEGGIIEMKRSRGLCEVGGDAMTCLLMQHVAEQAALDPFSISAIAIQRLRNACDRARCALSDTDAVEVVVPGLLAGSGGVGGGAGGGDLSVRVTRLTFEGLLESSGLMDVLKKQVRRLL